MHNAKVVREIILLGRNRKKRIMKQPFPDKGFSMVVGNFRFGFGQRRGRGLAAATVVASIYALHHYHQIGFFYCN